MNDPGLFETVNILSQRDNTEFIEEYEDEIGQISGRCLDVGSGPGNLLVEIILPKLNPETTVVCSDISQSMVNFAKKKYGDNPRLSFMELDIETPNLPNHLKEQFDLVTSFYCLHWCKDMCQAFENVFDLLRPGGTAFLIFLADFPSFSTFKDLAAMPRYQPYMKDAERYVPAFQHSERPRHALKALIKDLGFEVRHCSVRERSYTFEKPDVLKKFLVSVSPFMGRIPPELSEAYAKDMFEEFARRSIILKSDNKNGEEFSTLVTYHTFAIYLEKPLTK